MLKHLVNPFHFKNTPVSISIDSDWLWFNANDVCIALAIPWTDETLSELSTDWLAILRNDHAENCLNEWFINATGLYRLIFQSNSPHAVQFSDWVHYEVWPNIRKGGFFVEPTHEQRLEYSKQLINIIDQLTRTTNQSHKTILLNELRDCCNLIGRRMTDIDLSGIDLDYVKTIVSSLKATAKIIAATIDDGTIKADEAYSLIMTITDRLQDWLDTN